PKATLFQDLYPIPLMSTRSHLCHVMAVSDIDRGVINTETPYGVGRRRRRHGESERGSFWLLPGSGFRLKWVDELGGTLKGKRNTGDGRPRTDSRHPRVRFTHEALTLPRAARAHGPCP